MCNTKLSQTQALAFLRKRYEQQAERWPLLRVHCTEEQYVTANLPRALKLDATHPIEHGVRA